MAMRCPLCHLRAAKRSCPALGWLICPVCCGTKRLVEIRCPETCVYLSSARMHPPASVRRQQELDIAVLSPALAGLSDERQKLLLFLLTLVDQFRGEGFEAAADADVASAARALASTFETASRGVIYEHRADTLPAQRMAEGIKEVFDKLGRGRPSGFAADAAAVLRQLEDRVQAVQRLHPSEPRVFLELAGRVATRVGGPGAPGPEADGHASSGGSSGPTIIVP